MPETGLYSNVLINNECFALHFNYTVIYFWYRIAEQRRLEKLEERAAKQRVLDQIARDRAEREAKFSKKPEAAVAPTPAPAAAPAPVAKKDYTECRLQVGYGRWRRLKSDGAIFPICLLTVCHANILLSDSSSWWIGLDQPIRR